MPNCAVCSVHFLWLNWSYYSNRSVAGAAVDGDVNDDCDAVDAVGGGDFVDAGGRFVAMRLSLTALCRY